MAHFRNFPPVTMNILSTATKFLRKNFLPFCSACFLFAVLPNLHSACTITITGSGPCRIDPSNSNNALFQTPTIGEVYPLYVKFHVQGTARPFTVNFALGPQPKNGVVISHTNPISVGNLTTGDYFYWAWFYDPMRTLDHPLSWSISVDPGNVSGNTATNAWVSGVFSPLEPTNIVSLFGTNTVRGYQNVTFNSPSLIQQGLIVFGDPPNFPTQTILADPGPVGSLRYLTQPLGINMFLNYLTNVPVGPLKLSQQFTAQLSSVTVNGNLMRQITWQQLSNSIPANVKPYLQPDSIVDCTNPVVLALVNKVLPNNYESKLSPYETACLFHLYFQNTNNMKYNENVIDCPASYVISKGKSDCGGYACAFEACLRAVGIPARSIYGYWVSADGSTSAHVRSQFYLPGAGWILSDSCIAQTDCDPTGTYAYLFGNVIDANKYLAVTVGDSHIVTYGSTNFDESWIQDPKIYRGLNRENACAYQYYESITSITQVQNCSTPVLSNPQALLVSTNGIKGYAFSVTYKNTFGDPPSYVLVRNTLPSLGTNNYWALSPAPTNNYNFTIGVVYQGFLAQTYTNKFVPFQFESSNGLTNAATNPVVAAGGIPK